MKMKCFSKRKLNLRKIQIFTNLQPFNFNLQQDLKIATFCENPEKSWSTFSKIQQILAKFATFFFSARRVEDELRKDQTPTGDAWP